MNAHDITNELHRDGCAECRALWADLDRISAEARELPQLTPSRDLWAGIEARIGGTAGQVQGQVQGQVPGATPAVAIPVAAAERARRRWFASPTLRLAAAASFLVAATAAITWQVASSRTAPAIETAAGSEAPIPDLAAGAADLPRADLLREAAYETDFGRMDDEIAAIRLIVDERLQRLDPATVEVLERNLAVIDTAIAESRKALLADPASAFLATELARAYTTKLDLLRTTAKLPAGT